MNSDPLFAQLEPPSGGVERFRQRLAEPERAPAAGRWLGAVSVLAIAALVAALLYLPDARERTVVAGSSLIDAPEFDRLLGREPRDVPLSVQLNEQPIEAEQLQSTDPKVR